jgi:hypothetical protein
MAFNLEDYEDVATLNKWFIAIIQWVDLIYQLLAMILKRVISWCKQPCGEIAADPAPAVATLHLDLEKPIWLI